MSEYAGPDAPLLKAAFSLGQLGQANPEVLVALDRALQSFQH